ncbi:uncharacterized protein LOC129244249 [Anastrepha obliqua]|uniref:uncharacterized protein LOC129244249 n=1 Tax=Anastrepha obliqua TaxID=95512 RepID=UPI002409F26A|nr:uncharacterized protein LOC129244249 [Anastrepha obliqua]
MTFRGKNSFRGLQKAVNALLGDDDEGNDDIIPDLVIIPPDLDQLTDTEEFDEDNLDDNMMPTDVPGHIELDIVEDMIDYNKSTASASAAVIDSTLDGPSTSAAASRQNSISEKYLSIVKWVDNSVCSMLTNFDTITPVNYVKRWSRESQSKINVPQPNLYATYNKHMGGVDNIDQNVNVYRIALKGKKWWWVIFTYLLDLTMTNAWKFYISLNNKNDKFNTQLEKACTFFIC